MIKTNEDEGEEETRKRTRNRTRSKTSTQKKEMGTHGERDATRKEDEEEKDTLNKTKVYILHIVLNNNYIFSRYQKQRFITIDDGIVGVFVARGRAPYALPVKSHCLNTLKALPTADFTYT